MHLFMKGFPMHTSSMRGLRNRMVQVSCCNPTQRRTWTQVVAMTHFRGQGMHRCPCVCLGARWLRAVQLAAVRDTSRLPRVGRAQCNVCWYGGIWDSEGRSVNIGDSTRPWSAAQSVPAGQISWLACSDRTSICCIPEFENRRLMFHMGDRIRWNSQMGIGPQFNV